VSNKTGLPITGKGLAISFLVRGERCSESTSLKRYNAVRIARSLVLFMQDY
jgi:hypothetical protein